MSTTPQASPARPNERVDERLGERVDESVLVLREPGSELVAVLARPAGDGRAAGIARPPEGPPDPDGVPEDSVSPATIGVVIVVGGPQTRVGSHRQFVLLARALAAAGYPCLRFDYTGMGDSPGPRPDFERAGDDIRSACDALLEQVPACRRIALWGLCDGATAALFHALGDARVAAVIAANPWARSEATHSAAVVTDHYGARLRSPEFWKKLVTGRVDLLGSAREALGHAWRARASGSRSDQGLPARLAGALGSLRRPVRLQLSGRDLTAAEFEIAMKPAGGLDQGPASVLRLHDADHTFSRPAAWQAVVDDTLAQLRAL